MKNLWAIVPVKPLRRGKSRLAGVLSDDERAMLNYTLLGGTLRALLDAPAVAQTLVISRDSAALALARDLGAHTVQEDSHSALNLALQRATIVAMMSGASRILVLPADLPLINTACVQAFAERGQRPPEMIIAPDRHGQGTNALLYNPAGLLPYRFGVDSFHVHMAQAEQYHVRAEVVHDPILALDLDLPADLELLRASEPPGGA